MGEDESVGRNVWLYWPLWRSYVCYSSQWRGTTHRECYQAINCHIELKWPFHHHHPAVLKPTSNHMIILGIRQNVLLVSAVLPWKLVKALMLYLTFSRSGPNTAPREHMGSPVWAASNHFTATSPESSSTAQRKKQVIIHLCLLF